MSHKSKDRTELWLASRLATVQRVLWPVLLALVGVLVTGNGSAADLIARWDLNDPSSGDQFESIGGYDGINQGAPTSQADSIMWNGRSVLYLNGSSAVRIPNAVALNPDHITVSIWVRPSDGTRNQHFFSKDQSSGGSNRVWQLRGHSDGSASFLVFNQYGAYATARGGYLQSGAWHHVAGTFDGEMVRLYLNGTEVASVYHTGVLKPGQTNDAYIGRSQNSNPSYFVGRVADARIYDEALNADHMRMVHDWPTMIYWWPLATNPTPDVAELVGPYSGISWGGPQLAAGEGQACIDMDGQNDYVDVGQMQDFDLNDDFTIAVRVRSESPDSSADQILSKDHPGMSGGRYWQLRLAGSGKAQFIVFDNGAAKTITTQTVVGDGTWHHLAVIRDGNKIQMYVDGVVDGPDLTVAGTLAGSASNHAYIGRAETASEGFFNGDIADLKVLQEATDEIEEMADNTTSLWTDYISNVTYDTSSVPDETLYDFSYAGYGQGLNPPPDLRVLSSNPSCPQSGGPPQCGINNNYPSSSCRVFNVACYGSGDDLDAIKLTVDAATDWRNNPDSSTYLVIYFPGGSYSLDQNTASDSPLTISESRIILKGAGSGLTTLKFNDEVDHPNGAGGYGFAIQFAPPDAPGRTSNVDDYYAACKRSVIDQKPRKRGALVSDTIRGSYSIEVTANGPNSRDFISMLGYDDWVTLELEDPCATNGVGCPVFSAILDRFGETPPNLQDDSKEWRIGGHVSEKHRLAAAPVCLTTGGCTGSSRWALTFREPVHIDIEGTGPGDWTLREYPRLTHVGVEDMTVEGNWVNPIFDHHLNDEHDDGFSGLCLDSVVDSWVLNTVLLNLNRGLHLFQSSNTTVANSRLLGWRGHESFRVHGGTNNLFGDVRDETSGNDDTSGQLTYGAHHGPGISAGSSGTVYLNTQYPATSSFDAHGIMPYATLFDQSSGGLVLERSGGGHDAQPNHLEQFVLWNFKQNSTSTGLYDFWVTDGSGVPINNQNLFLQSLVVGFAGVMGFEREDPDPDDLAKVLIESAGTNVHPDSLYEAQLDLRCSGVVPKWVCSIKNGCDIHDTSAACLANCDETVPYSP